MTRFLAFFVGALLVAAPVSGQNRTVAGVDMTEGFVDVTWMLEGIFRGGVDSGCGDACQQGVVMLFVDMNGAVADIQQKQDPAAYKALKDGERWSDEHTLGDYYRAAVVTTPEGSFTVATPSGVFRDCWPHREDGTEFGCTYMDSKTGAGTFVVMRKKEG